MMCPRCGSMTLNNHGDRECLSCGTVVTIVRAWDAISEISAEPAEGRVRRRHPGALGPVVLPVEREAWAAMEAGREPIMSQAEWDRAIDRLERGSKGSCFCGRRYWISSSLPDRGACTECRRNAR